MYCILFRMLNKVVRITPELESFLSKLFITLEESSMRFGVGLSTFHKAVICLQVVVLLLTICYVFSKI